MTDLGATTRRSMLTASAVGGAGLLLAACGSGGSAGGTGGDGLGAGGGGGTGDASGSGAGAQPKAGTRLAALDDIPVGGGTAVDSGGKPVILYRPEQNRVVAFSGACTHKGCAVKPEGKELTCPCHGSVFELATGKVTKGPAETALPAVDVHISGTNVLSGKG